MLHKIFTPFPVLKTERLTLRQLATSDAQEIFTLRSDVEINKYLDRRLSNTVEDAGDFITMINENIRNNSAIYWAITLGNNNTLVGTVCLFDFSDEKSQCEIGYELLTQFQQQGIMKEAVEKVIDYAFNTIGVQRLEAFLHRENLRSIRLLQQCSFKNFDVADETNANLTGYYLK
jgi:[ribosomal protein S5]-alanine N-acetyltransferase